MAGCVLRASGYDFQPENFLKISRFRACNVFRRGARKSESQTWDASGLTLVVSEASDDFAQQVVDAIEFLKTNREEILRLKDSKGLEGIGLDFGVYRKDGFLQSHLFPPALVCLAGELSLALEVSIYSEDETDYLLRSPANREHLSSAIANVENSENLVVPDQDQFQ